MRPHRRRLPGHRRELLLFKDLATLRADRSLLEGVDRLRWNGPTPLFGEVCARIDATGLADQAARLAAGR